MMATTAAARDRTQPALSSEHLPSMRRDSEGMVKRLAARRFGDPEHAAASRAEAQVKAIQAAAAAMDRLAVAVEASR